MQNIPGSVHYCERLKYCYTIVSISESDIYVLIFDFRYSEVRYVRWTPKHLTIIQNLKAEED
jgi:hypothetical protein